MTRVVFSALFGAALALAACDSGPTSGRGFTLPDGDPEAGRQTFIDLQCTACHTVAKATDLPQAADSLLTVELGGEVTRVRTYGELVTSIINPSHRLAPGYPTETVQAQDGQSLMRNYNDEMTVRELIDLVAFLQSQYELVPFEPTDFPLYRISPSDV